MVSPINLMRMASHEISAVYAARNMKGMIGRVTLLTDTLQKQRAERVEQLAEKIDTISDEKAFIYIDMGMLLGPEGLMARVLNPHD